eukprot:TRINITY_DN16472_c0_g3_i1.p1 TRINITY_DN16472_c0_g3~~TRINITY_DN16472_c0_g3_i1.p1  ORF type:complete len:560 (-),score=65.02 TRINITY_DN16472_c0_g3_i1:69-1748(-)
MISSMQGLRYQFDLLTQTAVAIGSVAFAAVRICIVDAQGSSLEERHRRFSSTPPSTPFASNYHHTDGGWCAYVCVVCVVCVRCFWGAVTIASKQRLFVRQCGSFSIVFALLSDGGPFESAHLDVTDRALDPDTLGICTYNIRAMQDEWPQRRLRVFEELFKTQATIFGLEEALESQQREMVRAMNAVADVSIDDTLIVATQPPDGWSLLPFRFQHNLNSNNYRGAACLIAMDKRRRSVLVCAVHLHWESAETRYDEATEMIATIKKLGFLRSDGEQTDDVRVDGAIVFGDFNAAADEPCMDVFRRAGFRSAYSEVHSQEAPWTYKTGSDHIDSGKVRSVTLDYVWYYNMEVIDAHRFGIASSIPGRPNLFPSDHAGIFASFRFRALPGLSDSVMFSGTYLIYNNEDYRAANVSLHILGDAKVMMSGPVDDGYCHGGNSHFVIEPYRMIDGEQTYVIYNREGDLAPNQFMHIRYDGELQMCGSMDSDNYHDLNRHFVIKPCAVHGGDGKPLHVIYNLDGDRAPNRYMHIRDDQVAEMYAQADDQHCADHPNSLFVIEKYT